MKRMLQSGYNLNLMKKPLPFLHTVIEYNSVILELCNIAWLSHTCSSAQYGH